MTSSLQNRPGFWTVRGVSALIASVLLHVGLAALVVWRLDAPEIAQEPVPQEEPPAETIVTTVLEPAPDPASVTANDASTPQPSRPEQTAPEPPPSPEEPEQEVAVEQPPPPPQPEYELPSVSQPDRNAPPPVEAEFLAEVDNSTDHQTMATDTILDGETAPIPEQAADPPEEVASEDAGALEEVHSENLTADQTETEEHREDSVSDTPQEAERAAALGDPDGTSETDEAEGPSTEAVAAAPELNPEVVPPESVVTDAQEEAATALSQFSSQHAVARAAQASQTGGSGAIAAGSQHGIDGAAYVEVFGERDRAEGAQVAREAQAASLFGAHQERWDRTRAALENFDVHVTPGTETSLNTRADEVAGYIHYLHNKIHPLWWDYLSRLDLHFGPGDALSDLSLVAVMEFGVSAEGEIASVNIVDGSGVLSFDAQAVDLLYEIGPHRAPPPGMISSNGNAYIRWTMHRDNRGCGTFGASGHRVQFGGEGG